MGFDSPALRHREGIENIRGRGEVVIIFVSKTNVAGSIPAAPATWKKQKNTPVSRSVFIRWFTLLGPSVFLAVGSEFFQT